MSEAEAQAGLTIAQLTEVARELVSPEGGGEVTKRFNDAAIEAFRSNSGKIPGEMEDFTILLLTARGAKSGLERTVPIACFSIDGRLVVTASMGGAAKNPPWYHNLVANPDVTVELGDEKFAATAVVTSGADRDYLFEGIVQQNRVFRHYQATTTRILPVVELKRI